MSNKSKLIYIMDPHCGWCYGFGQVILELFEYYKENPKITFDIRPGGLIYPPVKLPKGFSNDKRAISERVEALSGVKFSPDYFTKVLGEGSLLNSEPPSRAILCVKEIDNKKLVYFTEKLLELEKAHAKNNSLDATIYEAVEECEIDVSIFKKHYESDEMKNKTLEEFRAVQQIVSGYPVLFFEKDDEYIKLAGGYAPFDRLVKKINEKLD